MVDNDGKDGFSTNIILAENCLYFSQIFTFFFLAYLCLHKVSIEGWLVARTFLQRVFWSWLVILVLFCQQYCFSVSPPDKGEDTDPERVLAVIGKDQNWK